MPSLYRRNRYLRNCGNSATGSISIAAAPGVIQRIELSLTEYMSQNDKEIRNPCLNGTIEGIRKFIHVNAPFRVKWGLLTNDDYPYRGSVGDDQPSIYFRTPRSYTKDAYKDFAFFRAIADLVRKEDKFVLLNRDPKLSQIWNFKPGEQIHVEFFTVVEEQLYEESVSNSRLYSIAKEEFLHDLGIKETYTIAEVLNVLSKINIGPFCGASELEKIAILTKLLSEQNQE